MSEGVPPGMVLFDAVEEVCKAVEHEAWRARLDGMSGRAAIFDEVSEVVQGLLVEVREAEATMESDAVEQADRAARSSRPRRPKAVARAAGWCAAPTGGQYGPPILCDRPYGHKGDHCGTGHDGVTWSWPGATKQVPPPFDREQAAKDRLLDEKFGFPTKPVVPTQEPAPTWLVTAAATGSILRWRINAATPEKACALVHSFWPDVQDLEAVPDR
jgi:hypothetical protein